jgi:hypothetical protein
VQLSPTNQRRIKIATGFLLAIVFLGEAIFSDRVLVRAGYAALGIIVLVLIAVQARRADSQ